MPINFLSSGTGSIANFLPSERPRRKAVLISKFCNVQWWDAMVCNSSIRLSLARVGESVLTLSNSGSWYPLTTKRAFALVPLGCEGSSFHVNIHREVMIRSGCILFRRIFETVLVSSQQPNSFPLAVWNNCLSVSLKVDSVTSPFPLLAAVASMAVWSSMTCWHNINWCIGTSNSYWQKSRCKSIDSVHSVSSSPWRMSSHAAFSTISAFSITLLAVSIDTSCSSPTGFSNPSDVSCGTSISPCPSWSGVVGAYSESPCGTGIKWASKLICGVSWVLFLREIWWGSSSGWTPVCSSTCSVWWSLGNSLRSENWNIPLLCRRFLWRVSDISFNWLGLNCCWKGRWLWNSLKLTGLRFSLAHLSRRFMWQIQMIDWDSARTTCAGPHHFPFSNMLGDFLLSQYIHGCPFFQLILSPLDLRSMARREAWLLSLSKNAFRASVRRRSELKKGPVSSAMECKCAGVSSSATIDAGKRDDFPSTACSGL